MAEERKGDDIENRDGRKELSISSSLTIKLFPHQVVSVLDIEKLEREKKRDLGGRYIEMTMGVFGDCPGFGKSASLVAVVDRDKMEWDMDTPFEYEEIEAFGPSSTYITRRRVKKERLDCTLIVASNSIIGQWEGEIKRAKKISFHTVTKKAHMEIDPNDYHIVLCSDKMYNKFVEQFWQFSWKRFIYDEAASTHIPSMKSVYAGFYWFVTATFPNLSKIGGRNNHFIKTIFSTISPITFGYMLLKNDDEFVKASFSMPPTREITHKCIQPGVLQVIGDMIGEDVVEMIAAGRIEGAIKHLGGEDGPRNLIEVVTSNKKQELQRAEMKVEENYPLRNKDSAHKDRYKMWVTRVSEIRDKLILIEKRFSKILEDDCSICCSPLENPVLIPCCQNIVCAKCITEWLGVNSTCHMCRSEVKVESLISVTDKKALAPIVFEEDEEFVEDKKREKPETLSKTDTIMKIILEHPGEKIIVFSAHDESFDLIKKSFSDNEVEYIEIKGTRESREKKLSMYQNGDTDIIFLNAKFNGAGINLQMTDHIIYYHLMDPLTEIQLTGRANRIGRIGPLTIHYLQ